MTGRKRRKGHATVVDGGCRTSGLWHVEWLSELSGLR